MGTLFVYQHNENKIQIVFCYNWIEFFSWNVMHLTSHVCIILNRIDIEYYSCPFTLSIIRNWRIVKSSLILILIAQYVYCGLIVSIEKSLKIEHTDYYYNNENTDLSNKQKRESAYVRLYMSSVGYYYCMDAISGKKNIQCYEKDIIRLTLRYIWVYNYISTHHHRQVRSIKNTPYLSVPFRRFVIQNYV